MKENDIIERLHKAYDAPEPDVLSKLDFSQVEMVPPPEKNLKKRYLSAVAIYAAACLVVAITLPFLIGGGGNDVPKPQPGVSIIKTEPVNTAPDTEKNRGYTEYDTETTVQSDYVTSEEYIESVTEPPISIDVYPIPVEPDETEPAVVTTEPPTLPETTTTKKSESTETTTPKRPEPTETTTTTTVATTEPEPSVPNPKKYPYPSESVRIRFYKDVYFGSDRFGEEYASAEDIPYGAKVYYKIETDPGYICTNFTITAYDVGVDRFEYDSGDVFNYPYFVKEYPGDKLEYSLTVVLAGDADVNLIHDMNDVETVRKYIAGDTSTRWYYGINYSARLDYNCDGEVSVSDVTGLLAEIENGGATRQTMDYRRYNNGTVSSKTHLLDLTNAEVLPHGRNFNHLLTNGSLYNVYKDTSSISGLSDEIKAKYDDAFFKMNDLVLVYCRTKNDGTVLGKDDLSKLWCTWNVNISCSILNPEFTGKSGGWDYNVDAICIPVPKSLNIQDNNPM